MTDNWPSSSDAWISFLASAVRPLTTEQKLSLTFAYSTADLPSVPSVQQLQRALSLSTSDASRLARNLTQLSRTPGLSSHDVVLALKVLAHAELGEHEPTERVEIVCTAPFNLQVPVRATFATTLDMVQHARETITLVGYVFTEGVRELIKQLAQARSEHGVIVTLIGNQMVTHLPVLRSLWPQPVPVPRIFSREANPTDPMSALHAKLLVCDRSTALVTSANFTYHGLHENVEIGVKVHSKSVARVAEFLDALVTSGEVKLIDWSS
jgi:phosphatidylserine/phosphatidylglycerophosphate/cardiolipin synthase-like enzyme